MRPIRYPDISVTLPPRLCGGIGMYASVWACGSATQDWDRPFDKREKEAHRFTVADTRGPLQLTVPIVKPESSRVKWREIRVSDHGAWWDVHRVALESAYGRTPYFEFYIDAFLPMLTEGVTGRFPLLWQLVDRWDREIRRMLGVGEPCGTAAPSVPSPGSPDLTELIPSLCATAPPYRQVRDARLGFIPGLSVLDLLFNLGPESQIYLNDLVSRNI